MKNKVAIITGASSGIGKACALEFNKRGAKLVLVARTESKLQDLCKHVQSLGGQCIYIVADVSIEEDCVKIVNETIRKYGTIHILLNNAGISMRALFSNVSLDVFNQVMKINFYGSVFCTKYALEHILKNHGSIIGVSSIAGHKGLPGRTAYSASKFALTGFLEALRIENLYNGLHVLIASPGFTESNIRNQALDFKGESQKNSPRNEKKMMTSAEVAYSIANAILKRKKSIVLTSQGKLLVFLNKFFPSLVDMLVYRVFNKEKDSPL